ncbi:transcriptional regulator, TetR family [Klenkia soli]|uniref:Transcriptional regulator, TetR family n=1 Tax=Klenkia soli TaxID=1052260 RepID=A0A1H0NJJ1_9ACTN|nr:TetR/AcrR family transcriptional regulator [Klenkia soli]SDO92937.1 transcriptional regulator, TetR family [Klenkia soli]
MTRVDGKHEDRRARLAERRQQIVDQARATAEAEGWAAVTTRRLADAIGYTQPVLYGHFPGGKTEVMSAVALQGFAELASSCRAATDGHGGRGAVEAVARAYLDFAAHHPALYEAMFRLPIEAHFAVEGNEAELRAGFDALAVAVHGDGTTTELFWSVLHGLGELERSGRLRPEHRAERISEVGARFAPAP